MTKIYQQFDKKSTQNSGDLPVLAELNNDVVKDSLRDFVANSMRNWSMVFIDDIVDYTVINFVEGKTDPVVDDVSGMRFVNCEFSDNIVDHYPQFYFS